MHFLYSGFVLFLLGQECVGQHKMQEADYDLHVVVLLFVSCAPNDEVCPGVVIAPQVSNQ